MRQAFRLSCEGPQREARHAAPPMTRQSFLAGCAFSLRQPVMIHRHHG
ncbi:hypothetical protein ASAP_1281 [Asaia bogorensis]|uniref:Uncharacterized protein n=1 Tax=Asaia bogorensis TaxID=91915 RepID=A0A060QJA6_9PROT|nr:hypothetical protein ASAP_1281 [Asaia bogorensis]